MKCRDCILKWHLKLKDCILHCVDFFYPPFRHFLPLSTFRYAVCGGCNTLLGIIIFYCSFHYLYKEQVVYTPIIAMTPHVASFLTNFFITFPIGFYLSLFVVFPGSYLKRRVQLFRYFMVAMLNLFLNYYLLKIFVEVFNWYPTLSYILNVIIVITVTYLLQQHFSFRKNKNKI